MLVVLFITNYLFMCLLAIGSFVAITRMRNKVSERTLKRLAKVSMLLNMLYGTISVLYIGYLVDGSAIFAALPFLLLILFPSGERRTA